MVEAISHTTTQLLDMLRELGEKNLPLIRELIKHGADPKQKDGSGKSAIDYAKQIEDTKTKNRVLAELGYFTSIFNAILYGEVTDVVRIIDKGNDINKLSNQGNTPLIYAIDEGKTTIAETLIDKGADVNMASSKGLTPLQRAVQHNNVVIAKKLIAAGANMNVMNSKGRPILFVAIFEERTDIVLLLIDAGADIHIKSSSSDMENSALHYAVWKNNITVTKKLIDAGADINYARNDGYTPLILASIGGSYESAKLLIDAGASLNSRTIDSADALYVAAWKGHANIIRLLIESGADINSILRFGDSPLIVAASGGHLNAVKVLLEAGVNVNHTNNVGINALKAAKTPEVKALIKSYIPKKFWRGFTDTDMDKFKTIFETEASPGQKPPAINYSCCPVCLAWIERSEACMYMKHTCPTEIGVSLYHEELYAMFQDAEGKVMWCTICGRVCKDHKHYSISKADGPTPTLIVPKAGADPFGDEAACLAYGGGGLDEKLARFRILRKIALELQPEVGKLDEVEAFNEIVEACWVASDPSRRRAANRTAKNFREVPSSAFPPDRPITTPEPIAQKPNMGLVATIRVVENPDEPTNYMGDTAGEGNPMLEIQYPSGHTEMITQDTLRNFIEIRNKEFGMPSFGHCLNYPSCRDILHPQTIRDYVTESAYDEYRRKFDERGTAVGGRRRRHTRRLTKRTRR